MSAPTLDDFYMTADELATRWRLEVATLANLRSRGEGVPWVKLPSGAVRYRVADVLEAEQGRRFGITYDRLEKALLSAPGLVGDAKAVARIVEHVRRELAG